MADFFKSLTSGISSDSGVSAGEFRQQADNFSKETLERDVKSRLQQTQIDQLNPNNQAAAAQAAVPGNPYGVQRSSWIFTTFSDLTNQDSIASQLTGNGNFNPVKDAIIWHANPKSVDWSISQRGSEAKTKSGTVLHMWRDRFRQTDYDDPKITITFQSGNILSNVQNGVDPNKTLVAPGEVPQGLSDFYKFMQLVDSSKIKNGQANLIHILYRSRIFPAMVISGFFDPQTVVRFTDSADNPFQVNSWSATFTIYRTVPQFYKWEQLEQMFRLEFGQKPTLTSGGTGPRIQQPT